MIGSIAGALAAVLLFLVGFFLAKKPAQENAKVVDLTAKIKDNQAKAADAQKDADEKTKKYMDELSKFDPNFHNDDDDGGKPAS